MTTERRKIGEMDLHAYVDGELAPAERALAEQHLAENADAARLVAELQGQRLALAALYGHVADEPVPSRLDPRTIGRRSAQSLVRWSRAVAAGILLLGLGGTAGWFGRDFASPAGPGALSLVDDALAAHRVYASEVLHPVEVPASEQEQLVAWISRRLSREITVPDLAAMNLEFVGGRLLPSSSGPAAQLMYEDNAGHRITLFIVAETSGEETALRPTSSNSLEALFWTAKDISCAIIGELPRSELSSIALRVYQQLG